MMRQVHHTREHTAAFAAEIEFTRYCEAHPGSPAAVRRPQISQRGAVWMALLGSDLQSGIVGLGNTLPAALADFDRQYLTLLHPPSPPPAGPTPGDLAPEAS